VNSADYAIWQCKRELQRARDARSGNFTTKKTVGVKSVEYDLKKEKSQGVTTTRCEECKRWLKERDKFWGLESDSEEEDIKDFNRHVRRRSLRRDSRPFEATGGRIVGMYPGSSRHNARKIAGRGTWTTPWAANETDIVLKGRFGPKQGKNRYFFTSMFSVTEKNCSRIPKSFGFSFFLFNSTRIMTG